MAQRYDILPLRNVWPDTYSLPSRERAGSEYRERRRNLLLQGNFGGQSEKMMLLPSLVIE